MFHLSIKKDFRSKERRKREGKKINIPNKLHDVILKTNADAAKNVLEILISGNLDDETYNKSKFCYYECHKEIISYLHVDFFSLNVNF